MTTQPSSSSLTSKGGPFFATSKNPAPRSRRTRRSQGVKSPAMALPASSRTVEPSSRVMLCRSPRAPGYALHAVLCGGGHNIRPILAHLRALIAEILRVILNAIAALIPTERPSETQRARPA
ncbi:hypothetical protein JMK10_11045 [Rhodovulum sulfidophilum]|nr:hypothetical protein [Rhodovulum sulfidophilum]MCE8432850.1 hypothetical protein [Rhodovulum sulfidophilum]MCF4117337.1 hypothetical protein [Rhodovulum sulfidophilum]